MTKEKLNSIKHKGFKSLIEKALEVGVDVRTYETSKSLFRFCYNGKTVYTNGNYPLPITQSSRFVVNKEITKIILSENNIRVPHGFTAKNATEAIRFVKEKLLSYPLILKPLDGSLARGLTTNITSQKKLRDAIDHFYSEQKKYESLKKKRFIVEEMVSGDEYRILVLKDKVISCIRKVPATIIGDGQSSIEQLIDKQNKTRVPGFEIKLDEIIKENIKKSGFTLNSVLPQSQSLVIKNDVLVSNGATMVDCTHAMNTQLKKQCVKAVKLLELTFGGIDLFSPDISKDKDYNILEVNSKPVYIINEKPLVTGKGVDVSFLLLKEIFPSLKK